MSSKVVKKYFSLRLMSSLGQPGAILGGDAFSTNRCEVATDRYYLSTIIPCISISQSCGYFENEVNVLSVRIGYALVRRERKSLVMESIRQIQYLVFFLKSVW